MAAQSVIVSRPATLEDLKLELFLRQRVNGIHWKTKSGETISLASLSDMHLKRIIAMLEKNYADFEHLEDCESIH